MELDEHTCPICGGPAKLRYQTVLRDGIRVPVEPFLACPEGHVTALPGRDLEPAERDGPRVTDTELIG